MTISDLSSSSFFKTLVALLVSCAFVFCILTVPSVYAQSDFQNSGGITIQPSLLEESADPGESFSSVLRVTNGTKHPQTYHLSTRDISDVSEKNTPSFAESGEETVLGLASWVALSRSSIEVGAGEMAEIDFTVNVPQDASPGSHMGGIFVGMKAETPDVIGTGIGYQVVSIINIRISGDATEEARIREFTSDKLLYSKPTVSFTTKIENTGNITVKPRGPLEIYDMSGKKIASVEVNEAESLIVPFKIREFKSEWTDDELRFGRYEAVISLVYGTDVRTTISRTISFWILPMNIIGPVVGVLFVIILGIYVLVKLYIRKNIRAIEKATGKTLSDVHREKAPVSRLAVVTVVLLAFTILFLMILFVVFA